MQWSMYGSEQFAPLAIGLIIGAGTLAVLHALGSAIRNGVMLQELKARTTRLRNQYRQRLAEAEGGPVLIVDEAPTEPEPAPQQARPAA
jgi:hypothetical protein